MVFFRRIRCHFCGDKSPHTRSSKVTEFQCKTCEAWNYLDNNGDIIDTPASIVAQSARPAIQPSQSFSFSRPETPDPPSSIAFCKTCEHNQRIYLETLSNYLPDEDHPEYWKYEAALPQFKADLQQRYPQICKKCAPAAQTAINRADYNARTYDIGRMCNDTLARRGKSRTATRDDWVKWSARLILNLVGLVAFACLIVQGAWHISEMWKISTSSSRAVIEDMEGDEAVFESISMDSGELQSAFSARFIPFNYEQLSAAVAKSLVVGVCLIWYNPGIKAWYHHTHRMEAVTGQSEYFWMRTILLIARMVAWFKLSDPKITINLTTQQLLAAHGFMVFFMILINQISNLTVKPVLWRYRFKLTPKPDEKDVFGASADALGDEASPPQASSVPPYQLFARDHDIPFPIANLAPQQRRGKAMSVVSLSDGPPSPPRTDSDDGEAMEIDWQASNPRATRQGLATRSTYTHESTQATGWGAVRNEAFKIQESVQAKAELKRKEEEQARLSYQPPAELNPFRGRLPQAPMSMERKMRNPPSQFSFKKTPLSKQQDFMAQMKNAIEGGTTFGQQATKQRNMPQLGHYDLADPDMSPAKSRTRGQINLKESTWHLPGDGMAATGLEDLFGGHSFSLADGALPAVASPESVNRSPRPKVMFGLAVPVILGILVYFKKPVLMFFVHQLERMGY